ncbi:MAG TPA: OmpH family outer membrane protein [Terriglobia bacterium]|nr:OmpH family outer membrane protein [Terriglobia bacterium]
MTRLKLSLLATTVLTILSGPALLPAQQLSKVAVVDFERAVVESAEGKKASEKFNVQLQAKQAELEKKQKDIDDSTKRLQTGERTLSDAAKAQLQKDIDRKTTDLQRQNEDAQKELQTLRDELLRPIAERATALLNQMASEQGYTLVVDISNPQNNVVFWNKNNDVTEELVKRINATTPTAEAPKAPAAAPKATTPAPVGARPAGPATTAPRPPATTPKP